MVISPMDLVLQTEDKDYVWENGHGDHRTCIVQLLCPKKWHQKIVVCGGRRNGVLMQCGRMK